jgi:hypothetical protein
MQTVNVTCPDCLYFGSCETFVIGNMSICLDFSAKYEVKKRYEAYDILFSNKNLTRDMYNKKKYNSNK